MTRRLGLALILTMAAGCQPVLPFAAPLATAVDL
jgi:hypothetical protein